MNHLERMTNWQKKPFFIIVILTLLFGIVGKVAAQEAVQQLPNALIAYIGEDNNLWVVSPDGSNKVQLTTDAQRKIISYQAPVWSPDGKKIAFIRYAAPVHGGGLVWMDLTGGIKPGPINEVGWTFAFDWSPDSTRLIVDYEDLGMMHQIQSYHLITGNTQIIYEFPMPEFNSADSKIYEVITTLRISPDQKFLYLAAGAYGEYAGSYHFVIDLQTQAILWQFRMGENLCSWSPIVPNLLCDGVILKGNPDNLLPAEIQNNPNYVTPEFKAGIFDPAGKLILDLSQFAPNGWASFFWAKDGQSLLIGQRAVKSMAIDKLDLATLLSTHVISNLPILNVYSGLKSNSPDGIHYLFFAQEHLILNVQTGQTTSLEFLGSLQSPDWQPNVRLTPPVKNIQVKPGIERGELNLSWEIPDDIQIKSYEFRYSVIPMSEANWEKATIIHPGVIAGNTPKKWILGLPATVVQMLYIGVRYESEEGLLSEVANSGLIVDSGFRLSPHGFSFSNSDWVNDLLITGQKWGMYPFPPADGDFTATDMQRMYGTEAVCINNVGFCTLKPTALILLTQWNGYANAGHCYGFAVNTSHAFVADQGEKFSEILQEVRKDITYDNMIQYSYPAAGEIINSQKDFLPKDKDNLINYLIASPMDPPMIAVYLNENSAHAITPYLVSEVEPQVYEIWVYDSNYPASLNALEPDEILRYGVESERKLIINLNQNQWTYQIDKNTIWNGDGSKLAIIPLSKNLEYPRFINDAQNGLWNIGLSSKAAAASVFIIDEHNQTMGRNSGQFQQDIPGASYSTIIGGAGISLEPIYHLPLGQEYRIQIMTTSLYDQNILLSMVGSTSSAVLKRENLDLKEMDQLILMSGGNGIQYNPGSQGKFSVSLSHEDTNFSTQVTVFVPGIKKVQVVDLSREENTELYLLSVEGEASQQIILDITRLDPKGLKQLLTKEITIDPGVIYELDLKKWDGKQRIEVLVDTNRDGKPESTLNLSGENSNDLSRYFGIALVVLGAGITILAILLLRKSKKHPNDLRGSK